MTTVFAVRGITVFSCRFSSLSYYCRHKILDMNKFVDVRTTPTTTIQRPGLLSCHVRLIPAQDATNSEHESVSVASYLVVCVRIIRDFEDKVLVSIQLARIVRDATDPSVPGYGKFSKLVLRPSEI